MIGIFIYSVYYGSSVEGYSVKAGLLTQFPTYSGQELPNVFLRINYTGHGFGNFTYFVSYNITGSRTLIQSGNVLVGPFVPYTYYLLVPHPAQGYSVVKIDVYLGSRNAGSGPVYENTIQV
jgi:hypothetical protein